MGSIFQLMTSSPISKASAPLNSSMQPRNRTASTPSYTALLLDNRKSHSKGKCCARRLLERIRESPEQLQLLGIRDYLIFGMPLYCHYKPLVWPLQRFNCSVCAIARGNTQPHPYLGRGLMMSRIYLPAARAPAMSASRLPGSILTACTGNAASPPLLACRSAEERC
jgi:hypothetical protein